MSLYWDPFPLEGTEGNIQGMWRPWIAFYISGKGNFNQLCAKLSEFPWAWSAESVQHRCLEQSCWRDLPRDRGTKILSLSAQPSGRLQTPDKGSRHYVAFLCIIWHCFSLCVIYCLFSLQCISWPMQRAWAVECSVTNTPLLLPPFSSITPPTSLKLVPSSTFPESEAFKKPILKKLISSP